MNNNNHEYSGPSKQLGPSLLSFVAREIGLFLEVIGIIYNIAVHKGTFNCPIFVERFVLFQSVLYRKCV